jgi:hypothetical protein
MELRRSSFVRLSLYALVFIVTTALHVSGSENVDKSSADEREERLQRELMEWAGSFGADPSRIRIRKSDTHGRWVEAAQVRAHFVWFLRFPSCKEKHPESIRLRR